MAKEMSRGKLKSGKDLEKKRVAPLLLCSVRGSTNIMEPHWNKLDVVHL